MREVSAEIHPLTAVGVPAFQTHRIAPLAAAGVGGALESSAHGTPSAQALIPDSSWLAHPKANALVAQAGLQECGGGDSLPKTRMLL